MTTEINQLVAQIKQATDYQTNKRILKEKVQTDLHVPYNNGLFKVTPELIAFLSTWPSVALYLEDTYENPIFVEKAEFLDICTQHYQQAMNSWHIQHEELKRARKV
jgi:hypothetical protein